MINKSVKIWTLAVLCVDLLFWLFVGFSCLNDSISCGEAAMFGTFFFYLPFTLFPLAMPWPLSPFVFTIVHGLLGALVGWLLRNHPVRWWIAGIISLVLLFGISYGFGYWQMQAELTRETQTQLWLISDASRDQLRFNVGRKLSSDNYAFEEGLITINLAAFDTSDTTVSLLRCDEAMNCTDETISFEAYVEAKTLCHKDKSVCQYEGLQKYPTLFEVTANPKAILKMNQILY